MILCRKSNTVSHWANESFKNVPDFTSTSSESNESFSTCNKYAWSTHRNLSKKSCFCVGSSLFCKSSAGIFKLIGYERKWIFLIVYAKGIRNIRFRSIGILTFCGRWSQSLENSEILLTESSSLTVHFRVWGWNTLTLKLNYSIYFNDLVPNITVISYKKCKMGA